MIKNTPEQEGVHGHVFPQKDIELGGLGFILQGGAV